MTRLIDHVNVGATRLATTSWSHVGQPGTAYTQHTWLNETHGMTNEKWQARIRLRDDVTSSYYARFTSVAKKDGYLESKGWVNNAKTPANLRIAGLSGAITHLAYTTPPSGDSGYSRAKLMASSNFWSEVQDTLHAIEGGELLGEIRQTAKMIRSTTHAMLSLLLDWKRSIRKARLRHKKNKKKYIGDAGDAYLQWKFGWDPLVKDIQAIANDLRDDYQDVFPITAKGFGSGVPVPQETSSVITGLNYKTLTIAKTSTRFRYDAGLLLSRVGVGGLADRLGIHPNANFLPTLWNLMPWSYMIDYVTNIGDLISALANMGCRFSYKSQTSSVTSEVTVISGVNPTMAQGLGWIDSPGYPIVSPSVNTWLTRVVQRSQGGPDAWPELQFRIPSTGNVGGRWQWGNVAAVLAAKTFGDAQSASYGPRS